MKPTTLLSVIFIMISHALALTPRFNPADLVRQARSGRSGAPAAGGELPPDSGEFMVDTSVTLVPAPDVQSLPSVAFDGNNFLVVWEDCRSDSNGDIYGARVTPQGLVLDPTGFGISEAAEGQRSPAVSFDGANFFVVWQDERGDSGCDIFGARVSPQGEVLDSAGVIVSQAASDQCSPALSYDGSDFLVVWEDSRNGSNYDIYGARVNPQGAVLDSVGFAISQAANSQYSPTLAYDGASFLVTWRDSRSGTDCDIFGARVTPQGTVLDSAGIVISQASGDQASPTVCFDGADFLAVWQDYRSASNDIYGARVSPQGEVIDTAGIVISHAPRGQYSPALAFGGSDFLVTWRDFRSDTDFDIYGARVTPQGVVLDSAGFAISQAASEQWSPAIVFGGEDFFVTWEDCRSGGVGDIYGTRVTPQGTVLDSAGVAITQVVNDQWCPAVGIDGANFLVVWEDYRSGSDCDIYGARVTPQGTVLDSAGFAISRAAYDQCSPSLAFDGTNFLVAWQDMRSGDYDQVYAARVTPQGAVLESTGIRISLATNQQQVPVVGFDGANFLLVWADGRSGTDFDVYGARVTPQGTVIDRYGFVISKAANTQYVPSLAFDGANFLLVWADGRSGTDFDIYGARVTPQATVLDTAGIVITPALGHQWWPAVAFDRTDFLVEWIDGRSSSEYGIYGARVTPAGTVFGGGAVVRRPEDQTWQGPRLCCGSSGQMLLVYQGWAGAVDSRTYNTERVWGMLDPNPGVADAPSAQVRARERGATVVRGVLFLPQAACQELQTASLLDATGRRVMELHSCANDVRALAPGVYFIREEPQPATGKPQAVRKVILAE